MSQACDRCHSKKVRCDKASPCRHCAKSGIQCQYSDRTKDRLYRQDQIDSLEAKIRRLQERNRLLTTELSRARSQSSNAASNLSAPWLTYGTNHGDNAITETAVDAVGERNYLGSATFLSSFVEANIGRTGGPLRHSVEPIVAIDGDLTAASTREAEVVNHLPPAPLARRLILTYLNHDHLCYPIILPTEVGSILRKIYDDPGYRSRNVFESFAFDMILAIATTHLHKTEWQYLPSSETHYTRAASVLPEVLKTNDLRSLQAVLLISQYRMSSSTNDNSASMWHLIGIATRIALQLGLHRESTFSIKSLDDTSTEETKQKWQIQEVSRLCFWSTIAIDRIVSNVLGRPLAIRLEDFDTQLPGNLNDEMLWYTVEESILPDIVEKDGRTSLFRSIIKYRLLTGQILTTMHGIKLSDLESLRRQRDEIAQELELWKLETENMALLENSLAPSCFLSKTWFEMIYHNAVLTLWRPSPKLEISGDAVALQRIFDSAKSSIKLYAELHRSRRLNHSWLTLQAVFLSGLSYIFAVGSHFRERGRSAQLIGCLNSNPTTIEVVNDTRTCATVLVAVSESWSTLRHCADVFNRLSDAVLADVIKFEVGSRSGSVSNVALTHASTPAAMQSTIQASSNISTNWNSSFQPQIPLEHVSPVSVLAVDTEFQNTFDDLQLLYNLEQVDYPTYQFSQAWFDSYDLIHPSHGSAGITQGISET